MKIGSDLKNIPKAESVVPKVKNVGLFVGKKTVEVSVVEIALSKKAFDYLMSCKGKFGNDCWKLAADPGYADEFCLGSKTLYMSSSFRNKKIDLVKHFPKTLFTDEHIKQLKDVLKQLDEVLSVPEPNIFEGMGSL